MGRCCVHGFKLGSDETLADVLAEYERIAAATDELVATLPDLGRAGAIGTLCPGRS